MIPIRYEKIITNIIFSFKDVLSGINNTRIRKPLINCVSISYKDNLEVKSI
ncbi:MAG: hypothetical protein IIX43_08615 [Bacteroidales bacterium]|nr:hypothetical protein [Bacteroidales bacterium]